LKRLYGDILVPPGVVAELRDADAPVPPLDWASIPGARVQAPHDLARVAGLRETLDLGESEAIALALEVDAAALLVDERAARAVAESLGLRPVGVPAMLVRAKHRGFVAAVGPLMDRIRSGIGFRISASLYATMPQRAGE